MSDEIIEGYAVQLRFVFDHYADDTVRTSYFSTSFQKKNKSLPQCNVQQNRCKNTHA
jgi:hypothetical protein